MSPVFDKIFANGPMREVLGLSVVRVMVQGQSYYLKDCRTPRFTKSTNNCSILDQMSAKRLREMVITLIVREADIPTVCGKEISVLKRSLDDTMTSLYERVLDLVEVVRIKDLIPEHILEEAPSETCPNKLRQLMVSLFREYGYPEHLEVPV